MRDAPAQVPRPDHAAILDSPIFIRGILPRSGTNFLHDALLLHPDCAPARAPVWEDHTLIGVRQLKRYVNEVVRSWHDATGRRGELVAELSRSLGDGITGFLAETGNRRLVSKTPYVDHIDEFFTFFPRALLIILVRDGRSVVQSSLDTFGGDFETTARLWAAAADEIARFDQQHREAPLAYRIVRYEDLYEAPENTLSDLLEFCGLDRDRYDFGAAARLPLRGSSVHRGEGRDVHWHPVQRPPQFDPTARFRDWSPARLRRFDWIAGHQLEHFGYERSKVTMARPHAIGQVARDVRWSIGTPWRVARHRLAYRRIRQRRERTAALA